MDASLALQGESLTLNNVRLVPVHEDATLNHLLCKYFNKKAVTCTVKEKPINLHKGSNATGRFTVNVRFITNGVSVLNENYLGMNEIYNSICFVFH